jgi:3-methylcrotonyl-CoA carboxylase alpha subunit
VTDAAVAAARAAGYRNAGTIEFLVDAAHDAFYFLEMNTRLQVEHPVTEMITGLDLVEWQLRVASGEPLPLRQEQLRMHGHAIEARVYAEDPTRDFLPSIGTLEFLATPVTSAQVRIDTGVRAGDEITPYYDPMIAKLIVHGATRDEAIARLRAALADYRVAGVHTNIEFLHRLTAAPSFVEARLDTALIERERDRLFPPASPAPRVMWDLAVLAFYLRARLTRPGRSPWDQGDGWRAGAAGQRHWTIQSGGASEKIRVTERASTLQVEMAGATTTVSGTLGANGALDADVGGTKAQATSFLHGNLLHLFREGAHRIFEWQDPYLPEVAAADHRGSLVAPMPGRVIAVLVERGARVAAGAPLVVMEAMKMEHTVTAPAAGTVAEVHCAVGDQVREGVELLRLE